MDNNSDVYTLASSLPNSCRTKKTVESIVSTLIHTRETPTLEQLAILYGYFQANIPSVPKTAAQWVHKAIPKKDLRSYLQLAHVLDGQLRGTDGYRVHITPTTLENGYYDKSMSPITNDSKYPNIERILPKPAGRKPLDLSDIEKIKIEKIKDEDAFVLGEDDDLRVNRKYLLDALCNPSPLVEAWYWDTDILIDLHFEDGSRAVIMPVRHK